MSRRWLIVALPLIAALVGAPRAAAADGAVAAARATTQPGFWTPERMLEAVRHSQPERPIAVAAGGGGGATPAPTQLPGIRAVGRVFSVLPNGQTTSCSGTLVDSRNRSLVWTAGHCVHRGRPGAFHSNVVFVPGYQARATGNPAPFGTWRAAWLGVPTVWEKHGAVESKRRYRADVDAGVLVLGHDVAGRAAADALGVSQHISFRRKVGRRIRLIGYPGAAPFLGEHMLQCGPRAVHRVRVSFTQYRARCPWGPGMSGGPALMSMNNLGVGTVMGAITSNDEHHRTYFPRNRRLFGRLYRDFTSQGL